MPHDVAVLYPLDSNPTRRKLGSTCWDWLGLSIGDVTGLLEKPKPTALRVSQPAPMPFVIPPRPFASLEWRYDFAARHASSLAGALAPSDLTVVGCWASVATGSWRCVVQRRALSS